MFLGLDDTKRGLKAVLENKKILKLIHDCRNDWDSLLHQYSVRMYNFIDTQEAYFIYKLFFHRQVCLPVSLLNFIERMTKAKLSFKNKFKQDMTEDPFMWSNRPLTEEQIIYASEDVVYLIKSWNNLKDKFNDNLKEIIFFLTILKVLDATMFGQFREYIIANFVYFGMLENVFVSEEIYKNMFTLDYVYNFLQIKILTGKENSENIKNSNLAQEKMDGEEYFRFLKQEKISDSIIQFGLNFKNKQRTTKKEEEIRKFMEESTHVINRDETLIGLNNINKKVYSGSKLINNEEGKINNQNKYLMNNLKCEIKSDIKKPSEPLKKETNKLTTEVFSNCENITNNTSKLFIKSQKNVNGKNKTTSQTTLKKTVNISLDTKYASNSDSI